jgi:iron complex outermembrane receptor protein
VGERGIFLDGKIHYDATFYAILLDDLLVTERITEDVFTGANAGKALNMGIEFWGEYAVLQPKESQALELKATLSYTLSRNRFTDFVDEGVNYSGFELPGIPSQLLNGIITTGWRPLEIKLHYQYSGRQWMDDLNSLEYTGHQLLHLQASWKFSIKGGPYSLSLQGGIRNIFNASYSSMILVNAPSFGGSDPRYYYPGNPRQFHLGISLQFR